MLCWHWGSLVDLRQLINMLFCVSTYCIINWILTLTPHADNLYDSANKLLLNAQKTEKKHIKVVEINPGLYFLIRNGDFMVYILCKFIIRANTLQTSHVKYFYFEHKHIITSRLVKRKWKKEKERKEKEKEERRGKKKGKKKLKEQTMWYQNISLHRKYRSK